MPINAISRPQAPPRALTAVESVGAVEATKARGNAFAPEPEQMPKPLTPATAAVHLMNVPSSHVLAAIGMVQRAMGLQPPSDPPPAARTGTMIDVSA